MGFSHENLKNLSYQDRCNLLNKKAVPVARFFQYTAAIFFKEIIFDGPLAKKKYCALT